MAQRARTGSARVHYRERGQHHAKARKPPKGCCGLLPNAKEALEADTAVAAVQQVDVRFKAESRELTAVLLLAAD